MSQQRIKSNNAIFINNIPLVREMFVMTNHDHSLTGIVDLTQNRATFWAEMINHERTVAVKAMP